MKRLFVLFLLLLILVPSANAATAEYPYEASSWSREDVSKALDLKIMQRFKGGDLRLPINRGDFARNAASLVAIEFGSNMESYLLIMNYRMQAASGEPADLLALDVAKNLGILQGRGEGNWDVFSSITRQEAAVMLARTYRAYHGDAPDTLLPISFVDQEDIAAWALNDVQLMNNLGVMNGVGDGRFDPKGSYTIEQCLVTLLRLHEKAPYNGSKQENPFAIPKLDGGLLKTWDNYNIAFAIETKDYYICSLIRNSSGSGLGSLYYDIKIIDQDFSLRSYPTPIMTASNNRGDYHARPKDPSISEDGTKLFYTATVEEDVYPVDFNGNRGKTPLFLKGIYKVTMDLKTGTQTYTRADLSVQ